MQESAPAANINYGENMQRWIGVDLDGTLAHYDHWRGIEHIGEPIEEMKERVINWVLSGQLVRIFTARATRPECIPVIEEWMLEHLGFVLPVTNVKDFGMVELWDDKAVRVIANTGIRCCRAPKAV